MLECPFDRASLGLNHSNHSAQLSIAVTYSDIELRRLSLSFNLDVCMPGD